MLIFCNIRNIWLKRKFGMDLLMKYYNIIFWLHSDADPLRLYAFMPLCHYAFFYLYPTSERNPCPTNCIAGQMGRKSILVTKVAMIRPNKRNEPYL
jgi:hypothetical protein